MTNRLALLALLLCSPLVHAQSLSEVAFLAGNWTEKTDRAETQEMWSIPKGDTMAAVNVSLRGARTGFEFLRIVQRDGKLIYLASPGGRTPPTEFALKEAADQRVVFENPAHDFPTRIIYRRDGETLVARIEGTMGGKERAMEWTFRRAP